MRSESGSLYAAVLTLAAVLGLGVSALTMLSQARSRHSEVSLFGRQATSLAQGGAEMAAGALVNAISNWNTSAVPGPGETITQTLTLNGADVACEIALADVETQTVGQNILTQYEVIASAEVEGVSQTENLVLEVSQNPLFQFAVFYGVDLEIMPGPEMHIDGRVHVNGNLYTDSGQGVHYDTDYVRASGDIFRTGISASLPGGQGGYPAGLGAFARHADTGLEVEWDASLDSSDPDWYQAALDAFGGTVQSGVHGVTPLQPPSVEEFAKDGYYYQQAASGGVVLDDGVFTGPGGVNLLALGYPGLLRTETIADRREGANVVTQKVDMAVFKRMVDDHSGPGGLFEDWNGVFWCGRTYDPGDRPDGTQFTNGGEIPQGMAFVSDKPIYIQGDFNTVDKKPAAIMADAINVLSNSWNNAKTLSSAAPAVMPGSETTIHAAILAGNVPTSGNSPSGGVQNLIRLHENWGNGAATLTTLGSMVCLEPSVYARGKWRVGAGAGIGTFSPPARNWNYDPDFNDLENLPPFTPMAVGVSRVVVTAPSSE